MYKYAIIYFILIGNIYSQTIKSSDLPQVQNFINKMSSEHNFLKNELNFLFDNIILKIKENKNKEGKIKEIKNKEITWSKFKKFFLTKDRIKNGKQFLLDNYNTLQKAEDKFGVQKAIIVAILGIETNYGRNTGRYPTMKTLTALAFGKNRRQKFYKKELEEFLIMTRKNSLTPLSIKGSHAGAIGMSQFISSSYNYYAIDFNNDNKIDLFNKIDAIGSVANYLSSHHWQKNGTFAKEVDNSYAKLAKTRTNKPKKIKSLNLTNKKIAFIKLDDKIWLTFWNFYAITRYNHDNKYAMVVVQLADKIIKSIKI